LAGGIGLLVLVRYHPNHIEHEGGPAFSSAAEQQASTTLASDAAAYSVTVPPSHAVIALGYVPAGESFPVKVQINNTLGRELPVEKVVSDCPCLRVEGSPEVLAPSARADVLAVYEAPDQPARSTKRLAIFTTDEEFPHLVLEIQADVGRPLVASPQELDLASAADGQARGKVRIRNRGDSPVRLLYSTSSVPGCFAVIPNVSIEPGGEAEIAVVANGAGEAGTGRTADVAIHTDFPTQSTVSVRVRHTLAGN